MQKALNGKARTRLRALAHGLDPVVQVGRQGLTAAVLGEIAHALQAHELIKVKVSADCPVPVAEAAEPIQQATGGLVVQIIGHIVIVYRRRAERPKIEPLRKGIDAKAAPKKKARPMKRRKKPRTRRKPRERSPARSR